MNWDSSHRSSTDSPVGPELTRVRNLFFSARSVQEDSAWADNAFIRMVTLDVKIALVEAALTEAAAVVREAQAPPEELFGPAREWAEDQLDELKREGIDAVERPLRLSFREVVVYSLGSATAVSVLMCAALLLRLGGDMPRFTIGLGLMPWLISLVTLALISVYTRASERYSFVKAVVISVGLIVVGAAAIASIIVPLGQDGPEGSIFWATALVPGYALLCFIVSKLWPGPQEGRGAAVEDIDSATSLSDDQWLTRARQALRGRGDLGEDRISQAIAEISEHADEQGSSLITEFGRPEGYAQSLPANPRVKQRRLALLYAGMAALWLVLALVTWADHQWNPTWLLSGYCVLVVLCLGQVVRYVRPTR